MDVIKIPKYRDSQYLVFLQRPGKYLSPVHMQQAITDNSGHINAANRNCNARDFIDFLSSGRPSSPEQGRPSVTQVPWDSPEGIAILDEWQHIRREISARRPVRTRALGQPSTDSTMQPPGQLRPLCPPLPLPSRILLHRALTHHRPPSATLSS